MVRHNKTSSYVTTDHAIAIVLMTDPAVPFLPNDNDYAPYHRGKDLDIYLKAENGSDFLGLVWPGEVVAT
jgi:alpha-glucosidase